MCCFQVCLISRIHYYTGQKLLFRGIYLCISVMKYLYFVLHIQMNLFQVYVHYE
ncbi:hypothetical protein BCN_P135 (plasmid) [Bacillus cereus NC7401]|nr:hypothetical protein BCN_P135 [Bacillus cereus NC7401]